MRRGLLALALLAGCAGPSDPDRERLEAIRGWARTLDRPDDPAAGDAQRRLVEAGEDAVPCLAVLVRSAATLEGRRRAARSLAAIHEARGTSFARTAWIDAVREAPSPAVASALLSVSPRFRDPEREALHLLNAALATMREPTVETIRAAGAMGVTESLPAMASLVGRCAETGPAEARREALRYVGRAARRDHREAMEFLLAAAASGRGALPAEAGTELELAAGRVVAPNWRAWWLDRAGRPRSEWLEEAFSLHLGAKLDLTDRALVGRLVERALAQDDPEPEVALLDRALGRSFGYVSPRDVFDPEGGETAAREAAGRAKETLGAWWKETSPYLWWDPARGGFAVNEEARAAGTPVDPRTGRPE